MNSAIINELINNIKSSHLHGDKLFITGVNNNENPDSEFVIWDGDVKLESQELLRMDLFEPQIPIFLNSMGSVHYDSSKVLYGQFQFNGDPKVYSYLLWLNQQLLRDSIITFDTSYDWSIISDAKVDSKNNLVILIDAAKVIDNITYYNRIIRKYNSNKDKIFEWISKPLGFIEGVGSINIVDSSAIVLEYFAEENGHIHSLIALNNEGGVIWEHVFHPDAPFSLYRINDIFITSSGDILCCGTFRNVSEDILETGYLCKLDKFGQLKWERIFYDQEEVGLAESGIKKVIHFNSITESSDNLIVIGGRVIHNFLSHDSRSDIFFAVLDASGCLTESCSTQQDVTIHPKSREFY